MSRPHPIVRWTPKEGTDAALAPLLIIPNPGDPGAFTDERGVTGSRPGGLHGQACSCGQPVGGAHAGRSSRPCMTSPATSPKVLLVTTSPRSCSGLPVTWTKGAPLPLPNIRTTEGFSHLEV
jgi:hypothetical protein